MKCGQNLGCQREGLLDEHRPYSTSWQSMPTLRETHPDTGNEMIDRLTARSDQIASFPLSGRMVPEYQATDVREGHREALSDNLSNQAGSDRHFGRGAWRADVATGTLDAASPTRPGLESSVPDVIFAHIKPVTVTVVRRLAGGKDANRFKEQVESQHGADCLASGQRQRQTNAISGDAENP